MPQAPHTDVDAKGEVVSVAINVDGHAMGTLVDARARLDEGGRVLDGSGFGRADTALFAYDTSGASIEERGETQDRRGSELSSVDLT